MPLFRHNTAKLLSRRAAIFELKNAWNIISAGILSQTPLRIPILPVGWGMGHPLPIKPAFPSMASASRTRLHSADTSPLGRLDHEPHHLPRHPCPRVPIPLVKLILSLPCPIPFHLASLFHSFWPLPSSVSRLWYHAEEVLYIWCTATKSVARYKWTLPVPYFYLFTLCIGLRHRRLCISC